MLILINLLDDIAHLEKHLISFTLFLESQVRTILHPVKEQAIFIVFFVFGQRYQAILVECYARMLLLYTLGCQQNHIREHKHRDWRLDKESVVSGHVSSSLNVYDMSKL